MSEFKIEWVKQYLDHAPQVIFDCGCCDGVDSIGLKRAFPQARVVAFEANPANVALIRKAGKVEAAGVELFPYAVSDHGNGVDFHPNIDRRGATPFGTSGSFLAPAPDLDSKYPFLEFKDPVRVPSIRLEEFCRTHQIEAVDVLHMDVQGAESFVLKGLGELRPGMIFMEIDATDEYIGALPLGELCRLIEGMGYSRRWRGNHDALYVYAAKPLAPLPVIDPPRAAKRDPMDKMTVCVTSFRRVWHLDRTLQSIRDAGVRRVTIAAMSPTAEVRAVIKKHSEGWTSFDVEEVDGDPGLNEAWIVAAYLSKTPQIIILHDDDLLTPEFGAAYRTIIEPHLRSGVGFASWRAWIVDDAGRRTRYEYFRWDTRVMPSAALSPVIAQALTHSPAASIFDRETVIHACKEAGQTLRHNDSLQRPGMLLGTEILVYLRHIQRFQLWLYVDQVLALYGSHPGSGTKQEEAKPHGIERLAAGYNRARAQGAVSPPPWYEPRLLVVTSDRDLPPGAARRRRERARASRNLLCATGELIELPMREADLPRFFRDDCAGGRPYLRDLLDVAFAHALAEDIILYCNEDIGFVIYAPQKIRAAVDRGHGVTYLSRRRHPNPPKLVRSTLNCRLDGGVDAIAMTPAWWMAHREKMPDMVIGAEGWDMVFKVLAEEWADGLAPQRTLGLDPHFWGKSWAYCDDVCWHIPHQAPWMNYRRTGKGDGANAYNRALAREFFADRENQDGLAMVSLSESRRDKRRRCTT